MYTFYFNRPHLDKSSGTLGPHAFRNFLDTATRVSNAQYDDPTILKTLDVKLLLTSGEDYGWDIFQLDYSTGGPLEAVCIQLNIKLHKYVYVLLIYYFIIVITI